MKESLQAAYELELANLNQLQEWQKKAVTDIDYWQLLIDSQQKFLDILRVAMLQKESFPDYPEITPTQVLGESEVWQQAIAKALAANDYTAENILPLIMLTATGDRLQDFYQQAAGNVAHPLSKIFLNSLSELKQLQNMKAGMVLSAWQNKLWGKLGFAPFSNI